MEEYPCYFSLSLSLTLLYSSVIYFSSFLLFSYFSFPSFYFLPFHASFFLPAPHPLLFVQFLLSLVLRPRRQSFFLVFPHFSGRFTVRRGRARTGHPGKRKRRDGKERNALWYTGRKWRSSMERKACSEARRRATFSRSNDTVLVPRKYCYLDREFHSSSEQSFQDPPLPPRPPYRPHYALLSGCARWSIQNKI